MDLREYLQILKKRIILILIIIFSATLISGVLSYFVIKPTYKSDISVIIGNAATGADTSKQTMDYNQLLMYQMLVKTYIELARSRTVAENAIKSLALDIKPEELQSMISVSSKSDTEFLTITVRSKDAKQAMLIANQLAVSLKEVSVAVKKMDNVQILDPALLPSAPDSPRPALNIAIAFLLSFIVSVGFAFLLDYLDNTVKTQEDVAKLLGVPVIGLIPYESDGK